MTATPLRIAIAGGGIAGLATAIALRAGGHDCRIFERRPDPVSGGGAMLMWPNGFAALDSLGLGARVRAGATDIHRIEFCSAAGRHIATWSVNGGVNSPVRLIFRNELLAALLSAVPEAAQYFGHAVSSCTPRGRGVTLRFSGERPDEVADLLVACDGIHSQIRAQLFGQPLPPKVQQIAWFATVQHDDTDLVPGGVAIGSMGDGQRFCAARVDAARVFWYATVCVRRRPMHPGAAGLAEVFAGWHRPISELLLAASESAMIGPVELTDLAPLRRWTRGFVTLLGDAAHACLPDLGQGACQAFESAVTLGQCLVPGVAVEDALRRYEARRRRAVASVADITRLVSSWSMSEAVHVTALRDLLVRYLLPTMGFPAIGRLARLDSPYTSSL